MAKMISGRGFWAITPDGYTVHINGRRDMSQETLDAVLALMDLAHKNASEKMPCGHTRADVVSSGEGTSFCGQCVLDEAEGKGE